MQVSCFSFLFSPHVSYHSSDFITVTEHMILENRHQNGREHNRVYDLFGSLFSSLSTLNFLGNYYLILQDWYSLFSFHPFIASSCLSSHPSLRRFQDFKSHNNLLEFSYRNGALLGASLWRWEMVWMLIFSGSSGASERCGPVYLSGHINIHVQSKAPSRG